MPTISKPTKLQKVEHILASGIGVLDFAVEGEDEYYTWNGTEDANWTVEDVERIQNTSEDRYLVFPTEKHFICEIGSNSEEENNGSIRCWCE